MTAIGLHGLIDDIRPCDVAIVLGSEVKSDGNPSDRLKGRLERAASLYRQKIIPKIIVSGGQGASGYEEAAVMKQYLVGIGVPETDIIEDRNGINTMETGRNAAMIMKEKGFDSALIVTQFFHILRTSHALRAFGVKDVAHAHAEYYELRDIYSLARETVAVPVYSLRLSSE